MNSEYQKSIAYIEQWMRSFDWAPEHMIQVARLSTMIFDQLKSLHKLGEQERFILEAAALAHDIGFLVNESSHHKTSRDLILENDFPGIDERSKGMIALVARYHRKAVPKMKHKAFASLDSGDRKRVARLAAILRVADGLDRSHNNIVKELDCSIQSGLITIRLKTRGEYSLDRYGGEKKKSLFEEVFGKKLVFEFSGFS